MVVQKDAAILVPEKTDPVGGVASQTSGAMSEILGRERVVL
jgi:hypothetical protein